MLRIRGAPFASFATALLGIASGCGGHSTDHATAHVDAGAEAGGGSSEPLAIPPGGDHFCKAQLSPDAAFLAGVESRCRVVFANGQPLTAEERERLDTSCRVHLSGQVVDSCQRADVVAYCQEYALSSPRAGYTLIYRAPINPDAAAVSLNAVAICSGAAYLPTGERLHASCTGKVSASVDGQPLTFPRIAECTFKSDGARSELSFIAAHDAANIRDNRALDVAVREEGGAYRFGAVGLYPAANYSEGGSMGSYAAFNLPEDPATLKLNVVAFTPRGANFQATFEFGRMQASSGTDLKAFRNVSDGLVELALMP